MIVRAATPLMPGAQLTPVRRSYTGPHRGLHLVRPRRRYGMGEEVGSLTGAGLLAKDLQSYTATLQSATEQGTAVSPDMLRGILQQEVGMYCGTWPDRCAGGTPNVEAAVANYAAQLGTQMQRVQQGALNNTIALPLPTSYYSSPAFNLSAPPPAAASGQALSARIENLTGGAPSQFRVGDQWRVTLTGPANSPVAVSGSQNGQSKGTTPMGSTDSSGRFTTTGTMGAGEIGRWYETWTVGDQTAGTFSFSVAAASAPAPAQSNAPNPRQAGDTGAGQSNAAGNTTVVIPTVAGFTNFLTGSMIGGIPNWALGLGLLGVGYLAFSGRR